jgi:geranylgeranyl pyrophosphate synthase
MATEALRTCRSGPAAVAAVLANLTNTAEGEAYELYRRASLDLRKLGPGRPPLYDDAQSHDEMLMLLENKTARSVHHAAKTVAGALIGQHRVEATTDRLAKGFRRKFPDKCRI